MIISVNISDLEEQLEKNLPNSPEKLTPEAQCAVSCILKEQHLVGVKI